MQPCFLTSSAQLQTHKWLWNRWAALTKMHNGFKCADFLPWITSLLSSGLTHCVTSEALGLAVCRNAVQFNWGALIAFIAALVSPSHPFNKVSVSVALWWPVRTKWEVWCLFIDDRKHENWTSARMLAEANSGFPEHRHQPAAITFHEELTGFRFHSGTPRQLSQWILLADEPSEEGKIWQMD